MLHWSRRVDRLDEELLADVEVKEAEPQCAGRTVDLELWVRDQAAWSIYHPHPRTLGRDSRQASRPG